MFKDQDKWGGGFSFNIQNYNSNMIHHITNSHTPITHLSFQGHVVQQQCFQGQEIT